jgi:ABC-2 type transport system permease protein
MSHFIREAKLFLRLRSAVLAVAGLFLLTCAGVAAGLAEVARQDVVIARIGPQQAQDVQAIADWVSRDKDAGNAAYYTFHATWDPPSDLAFAALGARDVAPFVLRVRALGLEAQLYEGEIGNPEAALPGRFDFAFVLVYLAPLFAILLFHDLRSGEREAGRLRALEVAAGSSAHLWGTRIAVRGLALFTALTIPFLGGAMLAGTAGWKTVAVLGFVVGYLVFWTVLCLAVAQAARSSLANAMTLAAVWLVLTIVAPAVGHVAINTAVPLRQGMELSLLQRNAVHRAWDIPKSDTMQAFFRTHPEWAGTAPVTAPFHWKWYFAFHQVGDQSVDGLAREYRDGVLARTAWSERLGHVLPGVGVQLALHRLADSDPRAQMAYLDRVREFHGELRRFYYPYIFDERPFDRVDFAGAPAFRPRAEGASWPASLLAGMGLLSSVLLAAGLLRGRARSAPLRLAKA